MINAKPEAAGRTVDRSLSWKLTRAVSLVALCMGIVISAIQISIDYFETRELPDEDARTLIGLLRDPATKVAFNLDPSTAQELVGGALQHPAVIEAQILLPNGEVLAHSESPVSAEDGNLLLDLLFDTNKRYSWELTTELSIGVESLGELDINLNPQQYGKTFLRRSITAVFSTLVYALLICLGLLGLVLAKVIHPLNTVINSILRFDVNSPEELRIKGLVGHSNDEIGLLVEVTNDHLDTIDKNFHKIKRAEEELKDYSENLEKIVAERTQDLTESLERLKSAQNQLIESEKLAALGGLVAGVSHEVNTPLGIAVTTASLMTETLADLNTEFRNRTLTSERLEELLDTLDDGQTLIVKNLDRAARLIKDFKRTAVDQVSEAREEFRVREVMESLMASLHPETSKQGVEPTIDCPADLTMKSLPGVLTQVITNLTLNSLRHAFSDIDSPCIHIRIEEQDGTVMLHYRDNGNGIPTEHQSRIFEPFFTTKRGDGGSGLGLNIVYNLVTGKLLGSLEFHSEPGSGVDFILKLPQSIPYEPVSK
ncbi:sensor histidine kinase [Halomonas urumqiensis]|uniref:histidine kinase n=1 Tax=Halomonas urumqiensis TaxID=1684789 RepID=A0A2N7UQQ6_9GAMM|nr:ATP-binding protein [Halomonas urumqiensis]PMR82777.1 hypothetical protein C1H70_00500 [Halomonas urumqiensis]PTB01904.1 hypothetical protein C6V82_12700 [Halomonas urumqiensis]GHE22011.1 hypothetical protein GCM10017767_25320 [Halomonas urumqiensis]